MEAKMVKMWIYYTTTVQSYARKENGRCFKPVEE